MFHYEPLSYDEAMQERFQLLQEGEYDAVVKISEDKTSKSGNPMMDMQLDVFDARGRVHSIRDFLVFTRPMMWKVVNFSDSACVLKEYEDTRLCSKIALNKRVRVKIGVEEGREIPEDKLQGKPVGSKYPTKNKIEDYIKIDGHKKSKAPKEPEPFIDDDIAF